MALSQRGAEWARESKDLLIWTVVKNLWDPKDNPDGFVSLGVAENALMHDELTKYINEHVLTPADGFGLTYGDGGTGSKQLQSAMAHFLNRKLKVIEPILPSQVCITNGVSCGIEHLSNILADPGDAFLLGQPYYGAFIADIELRPGVEVIKVAFGDVDPLAVPAVDAYEAAIQACRRRQQKVAAIMLCNPHNPLGRCYSRDFIISLMRLCQKYNVHLISDEIYACSVFRNSDTSSEMLPFTSLASINTDNIIDPALTHILYGLSKDFGANGLRLGCIVSQHNPTLHEALVPASIYSYASSLTEMIAAKLLIDDKYVDWYIGENNRRLLNNYEFVVSWAESHGIEYSKNVNAAFFLWVDLGRVYKSSSLRLGQKAGSKENSDNVSDPASVELELNTAFIQNKIFLASGTKFGSEKPGWFRVVFSQKRANLIEGLRRIENTLGLRTKSNL